MASASFGDNTQAYTYDNRLQTVTNTVKNSFQTTLYSESNTFNNAGNLTESVTAFYDTQSRTKTLAHSYGYDIFGQLTGEQYKQSGITLYENAFDYDFSGNLTELNNETFGVNEKNQLEATVDDSENTTLAYDDNGNLLSRTYLDEEEQIIHTETYVYDVWGHMVESHVNGLTTAYTYYPDGLRKTKTVNEETTQYYYDGDVVVNEAVNGQWSATNIKALGNRIVKRTTEDGENALMYNSRGDVVMILAWEGSAEPVAAYLYLAYGKLYSDLSDFYGASTLYDPYVFDCPILYAGQYYDYETGLYYLRARYYSPDLCRFISEDPIKDGLNWYAYCSNDPVNRIDTSGMIDVMLSYIASKNDGTVTYGYTGGGCSRRQEYIVVEINGVSKQYTIGQKDSIVKTINGQYIIDNEVLITDFGLNSTNSVHQAGDSFTTVDDTALAWGLMYNEKSQAGDTEYASAIYGDKGSYKYTNPLGGDGTQVSVPTAPSGETLRAIIHSHPYIPGYDGENFSGITGDKSVGIYYKVPIYLTTPKGRLKKYDPSKWLFKVSTVTKGLSIDSNLS